MWWSTPAFILGVGVGLLFAALFIMPIVVGRIVRNIVVSFSQYYGAPDKIIGEKPKNERGNKIPINDNKKS